MKKYATYKDSGVEWIGEIPNSWQIKRAKYLFEIRKRIVGELGYEVLSITQKGIKVKDIKSGKGQLSMDYSKYQLVEIGDFAMNHMDLLTGFVDLSKYHGVVSPDYRVFSMVDEDSFSRYYLYLFQMGYLNKIFYKFGQGSSQFGRWRFPANQFQIFKFPYPSKNEQVTIANFLEKKNIVIDTLLQKAAQKITLLQEQRTAIINQAVTKGLTHLPPAEGGTKGVPMKDSGVEWIGEIPESWILAKLKYALTIRSGEGISRMELDDEKEIPVYGGNGIMGYSDKSNSQCMELIIGRVGAHCGNIHLAEEEKWITDNALRVVLKQGDYKFLFHLLTSLNLNRFASQNAQPLITGSLVKDTYFSCPPISEQKIIGEYLDNELSELDILLKQQQKQIHLLKEYRQSLISEVVTGKLCVHNEIPAT